MQHKQLLLLFFLSLIRIISFSDNTGNMLYLTHIQEYEGTISSINNGSIINCYNVGKETIGINIYSYPLVYINKKHISNCYNIKSKYC